MSSYVTRKTPGDTTWFTHDRFGMFIHWGLYAMPARHEWVKTRERMTDDHYDRYFRHFDPDLYDPRQWARMAKAAGMKYAVMTAKHHEGFCMFDSQYTDYRCTNTPAGRDLIREYVEAFRAEGLRVGFYYSLIAGCNFRVFTYCAFYTAPGTIYCATYRPFCQGRGI